MKNSEIVRKIFVVVILFLPVIFYSFIQYKFSINIPLLDDYDAILNFLNNYIDSETITDKIELIFSQHNEHRIVFTRVVVLLQYYISGHVNFSILAFLGNLAWYLTIFLVFLQFKKLNLPQFYFLPIPYLAFQIYHYSVSWSMMSLQNYYVLLFALCSFYFLTEKNNLFVSIVFSILATFTSGSGFLSIFIIIFYLILEKKWKQLITMVILSCLVLIIYFYNYNKLGHTLIIRFKDLGIMALYFFSFLGSFIKFKWAAIIIGIAIVISYIYFVYKKYYITYKLFLLVFSFVILTAFLLLIARYSLGFEQALSSRYTIYSLIFLIIMYLFILNILSKKSAINMLILSKFSIAITIVAIFYFLSMNIYNYPKLQKEYNKLISGVSDYISLNSNNGLGYPDKGRAMDILNESKTKQVYNIFNL
jgi:hypothetical protein